MVNTRIWELTAHFPQIRARDQENYAGSWGRWVVVKEKQEYLEYCNMSIGQLDNSMSKACHATCHVHVPCTTFNVQCAMPWHSYIEISHFINHFSAFNCFFLIFSLSLGHLGNLGFRKMYKTCLITRSSKRYQTSSCCSQRRFQNIGLQEHWCYKSGSRGSILGWK